MNQETFLNLLLLFDDKAISPLEICTKIWSEALTGNQDALTLVNELFVNKNEISLFIEASLAGNSVMNATAILCEGFANVILSFGIEDKIMNLRDI